MKKHRNLIAACILLGIIVLAHIGLWRSDMLDTETKWRLTRINAIGWSIILLPAIGVSLWLRAKTKGR
ncbi:phenylalanyl-tRNA synthetase subunit beta [Thalassococcus sp. S3]|uniref:phenylalanyl-tRNA synthetase subunit beta n=1 Tax=Thalassococcus sp. S3 TaxID=2017482 RepID=UPI0010244567|nr:phenylalanyl-tRNA synthetase subunit beta [Thalassococcus sp. S3]QBF33524.1 phenylalanyl-tRNA synthetase subunit beta [Thalassococcus sp. S3]